MVMTCGDAWQQIQADATKIVEVSKKERLSFGLINTIYNTAVLSHSSLPEALASLMAAKLHSDEAPRQTLQKLFHDILGKSEAMCAQILADLKAVVQRDPAADKQMITPFLFFKGFHALQTYRIAHWLWNHDEKAIAYFLQSRSSLVFSVDIHPAAKLGSGLLFDHATGIVIGETAVIGNNVSMLHGVTLGGTGKHGGDRHPKISDGVQIGAGAKILGNIRVGEGAKVGAGSVVLEDVPDHTTVAGIPAKVVGKPRTLNPGETMEQPDWTI